MQRAGDPFAGRRSSETEASHWRNRAKRKRDCFCWGRTGVCDTDGNTARLIEMDSL